MNADTPVMPQLQSKEASLDTTATNVVMDQDAVVDGRDETQNERLDRNWNELLQEFRVVQTGTQIITGFLLAAVFQSRFEDLDTYQLSVYLVLVVTSILTTVAGLAPVSLHRQLFRKRAKEQLVKDAHRWARITLIGVSITVVGIALLIFDFALSRTWGFVAGGSILALVIVAWVVLPRAALRRASQTDQQYSECS